MKTKFLKCISAITDNKLILLLGLTILLQVVFIAYFAQEKKTLVLDEFHSYRQASTSAKDKKAIEYFKWISPQSLYDSLTVSPKNKFHYNKVYHAVASAHPPFFHFQLHTILSMFPRQFSPWFGIIINIFWFILTCIVFYYSAKSVFKNELYALLCVILWGFSLGAVTMTTLIRMYACVAFFAVLLIYLSCRIIDNQNLNLKFYILLVIDFFFGFASHYYFIIWFSLVSTALCVYLIAQKRYVDVKKYIFACVCALSIYFVAFMGRIDKIFSSSRGVEARKNAFNIGDIFDNVNLFYKTLNDNVFAGLLTISIIVFFIAALIVLYKRGLKDCNLRKILKPQILQFIDAQSYKSVLIITCAILYFIVVAKIAPYNRFAYLYLSSSAFVIAFFVFAQIVLKSIIKKYQPPIIFNVRNGMILITSVILIVSLFHITTIKRPKRYAWLSDNYKNSQCIFIVQKRRWILDNYLLDLSHYKAIYINLRADMNDFKNLLENLDTSQETIIYIDKESDEKLILNMIKNAGFAKAELLGSRTYVRIYKF